MSQTLPAPEEISDAVSSLSHKLCKEESLCVSVQSCVFGLPLKSLCFPWSDAASSEFGLYERLSHNLHASSQECKFQLFHCLQSNQVCPFKKVRKDLFVQPFRGVEVTATCLRLIYSCITCNSSLQVRRG